MVIESQIADANADKLIKEVERAFLELRGFSLVRFGDGELRIIALERFTVDELYEQVFSYQFGVSLNILAERFNKSNYAYNISAAAHELRESLVQQIEFADAIGLPCEQTINGAVATGHEPSVRAFTAGMNSISGLITGEKLLISTYIFSRNSTFTARFFRALFALKFQEIHLLGSHAELPNLLKSNFNVDVNYIPTPSHASYGNTETKGAYPFFYDNISSIANRFSPRSLVLSACGMVGKTVATQAKMQGSVFLDIGAVVDGWTGVGLPYIASQGQFRLR